MSTNPERPILARAAPPDFQGALRLSCDAGFPNAAVRATRLAPEEASPSMRRREAKRRAGLEHSSEGACRSALPLLEPSRALHVAIRAHAGSEPLTSLRERPSLSSTRPPAKGSALARDEAHSTATSSRDA